MTEFMDIEQSTYPIGELFHPKWLMNMTVAKSVAAFRRIVEQEVKPTREDVSYNERTSPNYKRTYSANTSFDDSDDGMAFKDWAQDGMYWVRKTEGQHPLCHTNDRLGATSKWRDAKGSYCCGGCPIYSPKRIDEFRKTMEMYKPLMVVNIDSHVICVALERTLLPPHDPIWGISTGATYLRVATHPVKSWSNLGKRVKYGFAPLKQALEDIVKKDLVEV